ncbi:MAG: sulfotransferase family protein [Actinomycetes bacterium]
MSDRARLVLLVGAPRSGTTWLQTMLGAHPMVATPQETDLFSRFLQPLHDSWTREVRGGSEGIERRRYKGLHSVLTDDEFLGLGRSMVDTVVERAAALKPGASVVVEKTPAHSTCADAIAAFAPDAVVVHLVRDGRDAAASLLAAGRSWGAWWAPRTVTRAAEVWRDHVVGARRCADASPYLELRYEDLRADGPAALQRVFEHCRIPTTPAECGELLDSFTLDRMAAGDGSIVIGGAFAEAARDRNEPEGFFGSGGSGGWRDQWSVDDRLTFDTVAGDLLVDLGYVPDHVWAGTASERRRFDRRVARRRRRATLLARLGARGTAIERTLP